MKTAQVICVILLMLDISLSIYRTAFSIWSHPFHTCVTCFVQGKNIQSPMLL